MLISVWKAQLAFLPAVSGGFRGGAFTAMAEGGEGEDEIQFLRTVSKIIKKREIINISSFQADWSVSESHQHYKSSKVHFCGSYWMASSVSLVRLHNWWVWKLPQVASCAPAATAHLSAALTMWGRSNPQVQGRNNEPYRVIIHDQVDRVVCQVYPRCFDFYGRIDLLGEKSFRPKLSLHANRPPRWLF